MTKISDANLATNISSALTRIQDHLITIRQSGHTEDQSIIPTVTVTHQELRKLTGRIKIKMAFIHKLIELLEDEALEVDYNAEVEALTITKPAKDITPDFDSFRELTALLKTLDEE